MLINVACHMLLTEHFLLGFFRCESSHMALVGWLQRRGCVGKECKFLIKARKHSATMLRRVHLIALKERLVIGDIQSRRAAPLAALHEEILLELYQIQFESIPLSLLEFNLPRDSFELHLLACGERD